LVTSTDKPAQPRDLLSFVPVKTKYAKIEDARIAADRAAAVLGAKSEHCAWFSHQRQIECHRAGFPHHGLCDHCLLSVA
jgi:hypothetical protein